MITAVTKYLDTTITNLQSTKTFVKTTFVTSFDIAFNQIPATDLYHQQLAVTKLQGNATATITAGVTVQSPQPFYVYTTVKVIHVPAVINSDGQAVCATTSIDRACCEGPKLVPPPSTSDVQSSKANGCETRTFTGMNTNAEAYFDSSLPGTLSKSQPFQSPPTGVVARDVVKPPSQSTTIVSFTTPFVHPRSLSPTQNGAPIIFAIGLQGPCGIDETIPEQLCAPDEASQPLDPNASESDIEQNQISFSDAVAQDLGHVPQALLDWMLEDPAYVAEYPDLASCLPGGPPIKVRDEIGFCNFANPGFQEAVPVLTVNTAFAVQGDGCFNPGTCQTDAVLNQGSGLQTASAEAPAPITMDPLQLQVSPSATAAKDPTNVQKIAAASSLLAAVEVAISTPDGVPKPPDTRSVNPVPTPKDLVTTSVGQPQDQPQQQATASPKTIIIQSATLVANSDDQFTINGQTLAPGSSAVRIDGSVYSIPPVPTAVIINGSPSPLSPVPSTARDATSQPGTSSPQNQPQPKPEDLAMGQPQQEIASLIMGGFGSVAGSPVQDSASPEAAGAIPTPGGPPVTTGLASTGLPGPSKAGSVAGNAASGESAASVNVQETTPPTLDSNAASIIAGSPSPTDGPGLTIQSRPGQSAADNNQNQPLLIGSFSLFPGSSGISISGTSYSLPLPGTAVIINGTPSPLPVSQGNVEADTKPVVVAGETLTPGSPATVISGTTYALPAGAASILVNGSPSPLPPSLGPTSDEPSMASTGAVKKPLTIAGQSVTPGDPAVIISGTTYSVPPAATNVFINGSPSPLPPSLDPTSDEPSMGSKGAVKEPVTIAGQLVTPGAPAVIISGTTYSVPPAATNVVVNGSPSPLPPSLGPTSDAVTIAGQLVTPGNPAVIISGTTYSIPPAATNIFINNSPSPLSTPPPVPANPALVIASQTLFPGQKITLSGEIISLPATGTGKIVVGDRTESLLQVVPTGSSSSGDLAIFAIDGTSITALEATATSDNSAVGGATGLNTSNQTLSSGSLPASSIALNASITNPADGAAPTVPSFRSLAVKNTRWETWM
ncbi:MAG: hypothetical protein Q9208_008341, partial [Pyrenodesmia sp. 3 TL-2023]